MTCPKCQNNSISFLKTWTRSGFGNYRCPTCGAVSRVKRSAPLLIGSTCLGGLAAFSVLYHRSWKVFIIAFAIVLVLDALMDFFFRRLELVEPKA
jgi:hypothetical protein